MESKALSIPPNGIIPFSNNSFATYSKMKSENILPPIIPLNLKVLTEATAKKNAW
jgi:hypothetical protein